MPPPVALIIPALNEEAIIGVTLLGFAPYSFAQTIVADNGSSDGTANAARGAGAQVVSEPRRGYGRACLAAIAALDATIQLVVFADGDGSDAPGMLPALIAPILRGEADLVIGARRPSPDVIGSLPFAQRFGNRLATAALRAFLRIQTTDLGPFRAIRREALEALHMRDENYGWTIEMQIKAHRHGLRVREVGVPARPRRGGKSKISGSPATAALAGAKILYSIARYGLFD